MKKGLILLVLALGAVASTAAETEPTVHNIGVAGYWPSIGSATIAFMADERADGTDYNGNGYVGDNVVVYYDLETDTLESTGHTGWDSGADGSIVAFEYYRDRTLTLAWYDIVTETLHDLEVYGEWPTVSGSIIAFKTYESRLDVDHNGDGDKSDTLIAYYDVASESMSIAGITSYWGMVGGSYIVFETPESRASEDLNGDGDQSDTIVQYHDITSGTTVSTKLEGRDPVVSGSLIAFTTSEILVGADVDGDGALTSVPVIRYFDIASGSVVNTGVVGWPAIDGCVIAYTTRESWIGRDVTGDGDEGDRVIGYYDIATATATITDVEGEFTWLDHLSGSTVVFETAESAVETDLNGDGDQSDYVIRYAELPITRTGIPNLVKLIDASVADGSISSAGIARALLAMTEQVQAMVDRDDDEAAAKILGAFISLVNAQSGKHIDTDAATDLAAEAKEVCASR